MIETLIESPEVVVSDAEFRRLLGYPPRHDPGARSAQLAGEARSWFASHGRPWIYLRGANLVISEDRLEIGGVEFRSSKLRQHLRAADAQRVVLAAVSAGRACDKRASEFWETGRPDEYFFAETFGSAVAEQLVASLSGHICNLADREGLMAIQHYSPGYAGWDIAEQGELFDLIVRGATRVMAESLEVLPSGMLRPKKSMLAVVGLVPRVAGAPAARTPCVSCSLANCHYRRAPYRDAEGTPTPTPKHRNSAYSVNIHALSKWARERVAIERRDGGTIVARFRFDGTTCSNMGRPLAFDYEVTLDGAPDRYVIRELSCRPVSGDEGHQSMCAYLRDASSLRHAIAIEAPMRGRQLGDVLQWSRPSAPAGCLCEAASRAHKWGLAFETIHYALAQTPAAARVETVSPAP